MQTKQETGRRGEQVAADHLVRSGHIVLDRNWRCSIGEVDLVTRHGDTLVIVEVKARTGLGFGHPAEAVGPVKLARLRRLAGAWIDAHDVRPRAVRIDVVAVVFTSERTVVEHLEGVS